MHPGCHRWPVGPSWRRLRWPVRFGLGAAILVGWMKVAANERPIEEVTETNSERNDAEAGGYPGFMLVLNLPDQAKRGHKAECTRYKQNTCTARTRRLRKLGLHRHIDAACDGRQPLFGAQPAHPVIQVHCAKGNAQSHDYGN